MKNVFSVSAACLSLGLVTSGVISAEPKGEQIYSVEDAPNRIQLEVKTRETTRIFLTTQSEKYLRGEIESQSALSKVKVRDESGSFERTLLTNDSESPIFLHLQKAGKYTIQVEAGNENANVTVSLATVPLKPDQNVNPKAPPISPDLVALQKDLLKGKSSAEKLFWEKVSQKGTPYIEPHDAENVSVTFLWKGKVNNVRLLGAPYDGHAYLSKLEGADLWHKTYVVPKDFRLSYRMSPNMPQLENPKGREQRMAVLANLQLDPNNHHSWDIPEEGIALSTVTHGHPPSGDWLDENTENTGTVSVHEFVSKQLDNTRSVAIYRPYNDKALEADAPLLILFDGDSYLHRAKTPKLLDYLIETQQIPPMRAAFLNNPSQKLRGVELTPNPDFARMLATEFMPWLSLHHHIAPKAKNTVLSGSSYGGLASLYIAFQHPDEFGKVLSQSGSFWWSPKGEPGMWLNREIEVNTRKPIQVYHNAGAFELLPDFANILETNRHMHDVLERKGYDVTFKEFASGHDYFSWRITLADGLTSLFPMSVK
ncbi:alpha/beta hydrolase-fold protein [Vibrio nigripulchritudo]|uniref:alpha/beta hydrolase-fold protein n=1 Tax=Vibrio nigripulchritudo TaxID=28173 RepID=UPI0003B1F8C1|nr:alpha/beta hydrolase-fold protein [Vibrio nigripulchritudo]CCN69554.1 putative enterobactin/ferric enterobactin esterase [Vibrio nigripulchritudo SFn118]